MASHRWTIAWLTLSAVLAAQVLDDVMSGSYQAYSDTLNFLHQAFPQLPIPRFQFEVWLINVSGAVVVLLCLTWLVARRFPIMRVASFALAVFGTGNALLHILGFSSSDNSLIGSVLPPLLLAASLFLVLSVPPADDATRAAH